jgi:hypothetical protein
MRKILLMTTAALLLAAAGAQAHTVTANVSCGAATFQWTSFASQGRGNGGVNAPTWSLSFIPADGGAAYLNSGQVSFAGSSYSQAVSFPASNGSVTLTSSWTSAQTRDGDANSATQTYEVTNCKSTPALTTNAAGGGMAPSSIQDTAHLSGGSSPSGTITFTLYGPNDASCSTAVAAGSVPVNGNGDYTSLPYTLVVPGTYRVIAHYSGDTNNQGVTTSCADPAEYVVVTPPVTPPPPPPPHDGHDGTCTTSSAIIFHGRTRVGSRSFTLKVSSTGIKSVTFYIDGKKIRTVTHLTNGKFELVVNPRHYSYGGHIVRITTVPTDSNCSSVSGRLVFVRVKPPVVPPHFTG